jgi:hypothetical protein
VAEVPDCGQLAPLLWACGEAEHHGGSGVWYRRTLTSWHPGSRDTGDLGQGPAPRHFLPTRRPHLQNYYLPVMPSNS